MRRAVLAAVIMARGLGGCAGGVGLDLGLDDLAITSVAPATIVPGTRLVVTGASFVDERWGAATLHLRGMAGDRAIDAAWPARFVAGGLPRGIDATALEVAIDRGRFAEVAAQGAGADVHGTATVEVIAAIDRARHESAPFAVDLMFRSHLEPTATVVATGFIFVNDEVAIEGDGFLLGGEEGATVARLEGCFAPEATERCAPLAAVDVPLVPDAPRSRTHARMVFSPRIAGIGPGSFTGALTLLNLAPGEPPVSAAPTDVSYTLVAPEVFSLDPPAASLGQLVVLRGGGFAGSEHGALTEIELSGTLRKAGAPAAKPVELTWIPEVVGGRVARYVVNLDDALGHALDLRTETGEITGTVTAVVSYGGARVRGPPRPGWFAIAPVKQVVVLDFAASFTEELRDFGLRAVDDKIRERVLAVCREAYRGVNIEFRTAPPTDFALFETVELIGVDPNDLGLFGYDNTPGKDSGNLRLYDRLGGVNAQIQDDGYPGYGGVFVRSLMGFSMHPGRFAAAGSGADPAFDEIFDPFRPDRGGEPIRASDLAGEIPVLSEGTSCPGQGRQQGIACAIFVLGNLIGGTVAHEVGHSLGLANPYQDGFHDPGDAPDRLMDAGEARPFLERAQLQGQGPAVFCDEEYAYLRQILPSTSETVPRPRCR